VGYTPFKSKAKEQLLSNISASKLKFPLSFPPIAKDLITHMLVKSSRDRLSIQQVKAHRWLAETPPLRPTLLQSLEPKVLEEPDENKVVAGYTVIADAKTRVSTADTKPEDPGDESEFRSSDEKPCKKAIALPASSMKLTLSLLTSHVQSAKQEQTALHSQLQSTQSLLTSQQVRLAQLQSAVHKATSLKETLKRSETGLKSELLQKKTAVERGRSSHSQASLSQRVVAASNLLSAKNGEISLIAAQLARLKEDYFSKISDVKAKEAAVFALNSKLTGLKQDLKDQKANFHSNTTDLHMNIALLRSQIEGRSKFIRELDPNDQLIIQQMHQLSKSKVDLMVFKRSKALEMSEKVEKMQEKCRELEENEAFLKQNLELKLQEAEREKKKKNMQIEAYFKVKKDEILAKNASLIKSLRLKIAQAEAQISPNSSLPTTKSTTLECLQVPNKQKLTQILHISRRQIDSFQGTRDRLKREMERNSRRIASSEDDLARVKCAVLNFANTD
jgi:hypothetical protein